MKNVDSGTTNVYLAKAELPTPNAQLPNNSQAPNPNFQTTYTWNYDNQFSSGLKDGLYEVEITAQDTAGNESSPYKYGTIRVDRTPPVIYAQAAVPYVLSNVGANPYATTLSFRVSESNDSTANQQPITNNITTTIKVIEEKTGKVINSYSQAAALSEENKLKWNGSSSSIATGAYQLIVLYVVYPPVRKAVLL